MQQYTICSTVGMPSWMEMCAPFFNYKQKMQSKYRKIYAFCCWNVFEDMCTAVV